MLDKLFPCGLCVGLVGVHVDLVLDSLRIIKHLLAVRVTRSACLIRKLLSVVVWHVDKRVLLRLQLRLLLGADIDPLASGSTLTTRYD